MLRHLGRKEQTAPVVRRNDLDYDSILVNPMAAQHRTHVASLLGISEKQLKLPPELSDPPIHDPGKQQGKEPAGNGPGPKRMDRYAVILVSDGGNPAASAEVTLFLRSRRHHYSGTVLVYLVIHDASR
jgi:hypothetical protein